MNDDLMMIVDIVASLIVKKIMSEESGEED